MSKHNKRGGSKRREYRISVRSIRRDPIDLKKLGRAVVTLAMAQAEVEAQRQTHDAAEHDASPTQADNEADMHPEDRDAP